MVSSKDRFSRSRKRRYIIDSPIRDKEFLYKQYVLLNKTRKQLSLEFKVKESFVKDLLREYNIKKPGSGKFCKKELPIEEKEIIHMYLSLKKTIQEIADEIGSTYWLVQECLKSNKIKRRKGRNKFVKPHHMEGKETPLKTRIKQSCVKQGVSLSEWKGFCKVKSRPYAKKWRKAVFKRDFNMCKECSSTKDLEAHHIIPVRISDFLKDKVYNGITLCSTCHSNIFWKEEQYATKYMSILREYENYKYYSECNNGHVYADKRKILNL